MGMCINCKHVIFCPTFGEIKCTRRQIRIKEPGRERCCALYEGTTDTMRADCQCENCLVRGVDDTGERE